MCVIYFVELTLITMILKVVKSLRLSIWWVEHKNDLAAIVRLTANSKLIRLLPSGDIPLVMYTVSTCSGRTWLIYWFISCRTCWLWGLFQSIVAWPVGKRSTNGGGEACPEAQMVAIVVVRTATNLKIFLMGCGF